MTNIRACLTLRALTRNCPPDATRSYAADRTNASSYSDIGARAFTTPWVALVIDITITLLTFGIMVSYVVFIGDLIPDVVRARSCA